MLVAPLEVHLLMLEGAMLGILRPLLCLLHLSMSLTPDHRRFAGPLVEWDVAKGFGVDFTVFQAEQHIGVHLVARRELEKLRVVMSQTTKSGTVAADRFLSGALSLGPLGCRASQ